MTERVFLTRLESSVQREILTYLRSRPDVYVVRVQANGGGNKGVSDCILCYRGRFIALEFKRDLNGAYGVTKPQEIRGRQVESSGGIWRAVDSLSDVEDILTDLDWEEG